MMILPRQARDKHRENSQKEYGFVVAELHSDPISVMNMGAMVKRDRNHPSVVRRNNTRVLFCQDRLVANVLSTR